MISVEPPAFMDLQVVDTPPGVKGNTASGGKQQLGVGAGEKFRFGGQRVYRIGCGTKGNRHWREGWGKR